VYIPFIHADSKSENGVFRTVSAAGFSVGETIRIYSELNIQGLNYARAQAA